MRKLIADHMNLPPDKLDPNNPLNAFYNRKAGIAQLSDLNENDPRMLPYLLGAYQQWIDQGADAFRIDTIDIHEVEGGQVVRVYHLEDWATAIKQLSAK